MLAITGCVSNAHSPWLQGQTSPALRCTKTQAASGLFEVCEVPGFGSAAVVVVVVSLRKAIRG